VIWQKKKEISFKEKFGRVLIKENREFSCTYIIRILIKPALAAVLAKKFAPHIISLRVEVNLFVLSSDWRPRRSRGRQLGKAQKNLLFWMIYPILSSSGSQKKIGMNSFIFFFSFAQIWH
jgi:hypothetical protein